MPPHPSSLSDQQLLAIAQGTRPAPGPGARDLSQVPDADLVHAFANGNPNMSPLEDWGRSFVTGVEKGATGLAGIPHALGQAQDWANNQGVNAAEFLTGKHLTPQQRQTIVQAAQGTTPLGPLIHAPSNASLDRHVQQVAGPYHEPQSMGGRYVETAGEMLPNAVFPGGPAARLARVALPAAGAQTAAELAPPEFKPEAKFAGALLGGGLEGGIESWTNPEVAANQALRSLSPTQA